MSYKDSAPVSAFAVYKKQSKIKAKNKVDEFSPPPVKKKKTLHIDELKTRDSANTQINNKVPKLNGIQKHSKKAKKKTKSNKKHASHKEDDDEPPPLLVPITTNNLVKQNGKAENKVKTKIKKIKSNETDDASVSELFSELNKTDPSPEGLKLFKWLIAPLSPKIFFEKYWECETLFIERNKETYYDHILTTQKLDGIFREFPLYYTKNVDVVSYENGVKEVHNEEGRVVASALYDYYSNGCSIRVLNPQTYDQKVHLLLATLQEYFGTMVGTNVYLTPPGSQGFAPHYDDIEAFPFMEVTVNAGDLLYFPRGTIHEGKTDPDSHSLHITVSVYQHTSYSDLLEHVLPEALKKAASDDVEFREGLPLNYLKHLGWVNKADQSNERSAVINKVNKLMQTLINYVDVDQAADKLGRKFMYDSMPPILSKREVMHTSKYDGDYMKDGKILNRVEIGMDTEIRLLRYHCLRLVLEDTPKIYYNTDNAKVYHGEEEQFLIIDNELIPGIEKLQNSYPEFVDVESLPIEDDISKAQLVSDLWERGLLVTNGPLPSFRMTEVRMMAVKL
ncbi:hypothetical protein NQ314_021216 [Rhamnusium bicolor]|uniref:Bifunctional lysine-specific demethylase and histidyl-hydroxylase n=1 Tax=Rhamnusium bicolor TaxID=1586634 RepID=A0AAV8WJD9_9CUCU|nr:hypothetical protein NQ314_021216 [Rhamnusium bicolor]